MTATLEPYPAYKASGVPWLGRVPEGWDFLRGKGVFSAIDVRSKTGKEELLTVSVSDGVVPRRQKTVTMFMAKTYVGHKLCWPGDLVVNSLWAWMQGLGVARDHGLVSSAYSVYRPRRSYTDYARYFHYLLRSAAYKWELQTRSKGVWISRLQLSDQDFMDMPILLPPPADQDAIVRFLDHQDRLIRTYIRGKQKLIALLTEQKQAIIQRAVTRGLNPDVKMKPSGVDGSPSLTAGWLGEVPEHWEVRSIKQVCKILRGKFTHRPRNDPSLYDGPYPFIQTGSVARAKKVITSYSQTLNEKGLSVSKLFPKGTLLLTIAANIGDVAILGFDACFPDSVVGFLPSDIIEREYLFYVFLTLKPEFMALAPVNTQGNLNIERIGSMHLPVPPDIQEQRGICMRIENCIGPLNEAMERAERQIALMREYRTRLIADVVTGKVDVSTALNAGVRTTAALPETEEDAGSTDTSAESELSDVSEEEVPDAVEA